MKEILKYNFYLSKWFAGKKRNKVIPGIAFLFLSQISFLFLSFFLIIIKLLPVTISPEIAAVIVVLVILFIMYSLQNHVKNIIDSNKYEKEYLFLTIKEIYLKRLIALFLFIFPFLLCFIVAVIFYK